MLISRSIYNMYTSYSVQSNPALLMSLELIDPFFLSTVSGINQQRHHCRRVTSSFSSPMTRTMESTREWKDQKLYNAMEIRHLVVPSLSSSRSLAEARAATLEGEKCGHSGGIVFVSFDTRDTTNVPLAVVHC